jgi:hypothetical protein
MLTEVTEVHLAPRLTRIYPAPMVVAEGNEFDRIEMVVSVFGSTKYPITTHMGIFRTYKYWSSVNKPCADLAIALHSFAAYMYPHGDQTGQCDA